MRGHGDIALVEVPDSAADDRAVLQGFVAAGPVELPRPRTVRALAYRLPDVGCLVSESDTCRQPEFAMFRLLATAALALAASAAPIATLARSGGAYGPIAGSVAHAQYDDDRRRSTIVCESIDDSRNRCEVDLRGYDVQIVRQLSDSDCTQGRNWGQDERGIWVDDGCRAEFALTGRGRDRDDRRGDRHSDDNVIRCESNDNRRAYCRTGGSSSVRLVRRLSDSSCTRGRSWGYNRRTIWVDHGCRAEFRINR